MNKRLGELMEIHNEQTALITLLKQDIEREQARIAELEAENERILDNLNDWQNGYSKLLTEHNRITRAYKDIITRLNPDEKEDINISP